MRFVIYTIPKSNSFGHGLGRRKILEVQSIVSAIESDHRASRGNTTMIQVHRSFGVEASLDEKICAIHEDMLSLTKDAPNKPLVNQFSGSSIYYQWSGFPLPLSLLEYFHEQQSEFKRLGIHFSISNDLLFQIHEDGVPLPGYGRYVHPSWPPLQMHAHIGLIFGHTQFVQPTIPFPFENWDQSLERVIQRFESYGLFKFNKDHFRFVEVSNAGKGRLLKISDSARATNHEPTDPIP